MSYKIIEELVSDLISKQSDCYYLKWGNEPQAELPAFMISPPYAFASNKKWVLRMAGMTVGNYSSKFKAEQALMIAFVKSKEKHGTLLKKTRHGFKEFIKK